MSRGPGHVERVVEQTLRDTDRSFTVEELAKLTYPTITEVQKKHRVAILRTFTKVEKRLPLYFFRTYTPPWRLIITNRNNVRSYVHGLLRFTGRRSLERVAEILCDPEIQLVMLPGGTWWAEVEINKAEAECDTLLKTLEAKGLLRRSQDGRIQGWTVDRCPPDFLDVNHQLAALRHYHARFPQDEREVYAHALLGKFEPHGGRV